uniref:Uncharacterized protein n=1 Tax=Cacopsylla melanoneura TaxID=428564 RepID=A0A8D8VX44_9HEMI
MYRTVCIGVQNWTLVSTPVSGVMELNTVPQVTTSPSSIASNYFNSPLSISSSSASKASTTPSSSSVTTSETSSATTTTIPFKSPTSTEAQTSTVSTSSSSPASPTSTPSTWCSKTWSTHVVMKILAE